MDQPNDDRAATIAVKQWRSYLPGLPVRHRHETAGMATCWPWKLESVATKEGSLQSLVLCIFVGPKIKSYIPVPVSMVGGGPCLLQE